MQLEDTHFPQQFPQDLILPPVGGYVAVHLGILAAVLCSYLVHQKRALSDYHETVKSKRALCDEVKTN